MPMHRDPLQILRVRVSGRYRCTRCAARVELPDTRCASCSRPTTTMPDDVRAYGTAGGRRARQLLQEARQRAREARNDG